METATSHPSSPGTDPRLEEELKPSAEIELKQEAHVFPKMSVFQATLLTLTMALSMTVNILQVQAVTVSLDPIGLDLHMEISSYQWLTSAYALAFGAVLLLAGRLSDIYGHKLFFMGGLAWFSVWSIATGFAPNEISIDIFRAMQGAGLGTAIPSALGVLGSSFPPGQSKSTAFATFSAGAPIGASLGAVFGGILTEYAPPGWRATFFVSAGMGALLLIMAAFFVPKDPPRDMTNRSVDWVGAALITTGLTLLTFALADGSSVPDGWRTPYIPVLFSLSIIILALFWFWEDHLEKSATGVPLMKTSLWFQGKFALVQLIAALGWSAFSSFMFFSTLYFQTYMNLSPILTTVRFLPAPVMGLCINIVVAILASRAPAQILIMLGCIGTALAPLLSAVQKVDAPYWQYQFPAMLLSVFGADFIFATGIMYVSTVAGPGQQALAGGVFNMTTQVGTAVGLAIMTVIQSKVTASKTQELGGIYDPNSTNIPPEATRQGLVMAFYGCAAFSFVAALIAATTLFGIGKVGHRAPSPPKSKLAEEGAVPEKEARDFEDAQSK